MSNLSCKFKGSVGQVWVFWFPKTTSRLEVDSKIAPKCYGEHFLSPGSDLTTPDLDTLDKSVLGR